MPGYPGAECIARQQAYDRLKYLLLQRAVDKKFVKRILPTATERNKRVATMDKEQAIALARKYKEMVAEKLPLKALYLYGSYSKGNHREDSDIDIAVVVDHLNDNYFEDTPLLWKLRRKISNLIEPVLLTEDMNNPLYCDITKTGILI